MHYIQKAHILSELLADNHELIPVINRLGICLGVGNKSIETICREKAINIDFALDVINCFIFKDFRPDIRRFGIEHVIDYFGKTIESYLHIMVPNIEKHLHAFIAISESRNNELYAVQQLFKKFKKTLSHQLEKELDHSEAYPHKILYDLKSMLIKHVSESHNQNLCHAVIFSLSTLEKDLIVHNRLRKLMLFPKLQMMDTADIRDLKEIIKDDFQIEPHTKVASLTHRETEILKLIVQGLTNKKIAEKLSISLNTVLTHRRNIILKTNIRSVSGLTFFCISHGLLSADELKPINSNENYEATLKFPIK